ncbi:WD40-repeat-containing domain protein, partial [Mycena crocata]
MLASGKTINNHSENRDTRDSRVVQNMTVSPRTSHMVIYFSDFSMEIIDVMTGRIVGEPLLGHTAAINSATFSVDGRLIVSASADMSICIWDGTGTRSGAKAIRGHSGSVTYANFSTCTTKIASVSVDETIRVWDTKTGQQLRVLKQRIPDMESVSFFGLPDGTHAIGVQADSVLTITDADDVVHIPIPEESKREIHWLPGETLVVVNSRNAVRVWDTKNRTLIM